ncbi:hypothetical protein DL96DRAFT_1812887 [Flagelloscypha sp. PMI_526]|nr:hypothetical protein DL96DRAFT_1812887 [Flagelloscypha sp. PMI_526]
MSSSSSLHSTHQPHNSSRKPDMSVDEVIFSLYQGISQAVTRLTSSTKSGCSAFYGNGSQYTSSNTSFPPTTSSVNISFAPRPPPSSLAKTFTDIRHRRSLYFSEQPTSRPSNHTPPEIISNFVTNTNAKSNYTHTLNGYTKSDGSRVYCEVYQDPPTGLICSAPSPSLRRFRSLNCMTTTSLDEESFRDLTRPHPTLRFTQTKPNVVVSSHSQSGTARPTTSVPVNHSDMVFEALVLLPNINTLVLTADHSFMWSCISHHVLSILEKHVFPHLHSLTVRALVEVPFPKLFEQCPLLETLEVVRCNLRLSLRHLKLWGFGLNDFSHDPHWIALNTGLIKSLTLGQGILDGKPGASAALTEVFEKNHDSLEVVQVLNDSFHQNMEYFDIIYRPSNLKLLVIHLHWSMPNEKWNYPPPASQILQQVAKFLMDPSFAVPTVHLLLSNTLPVELVQDGFDSQTGETWAPFDSAICARPDVQISLCLRETESEGLAFDEMKVHIEESLPRSLEARLLEIRQYHGALGGSWDMSDEVDEQDEMWEGLV